MESRMELNGKSGIDLELSANINNGLAVKIK